MKVNVLKRTKGLLKVEVEGEGHTFGNLMQETLLEDKTVDWAGYDQPHPLFRQSIITVRVKGEAQPEKALERASKKIRADTEEFVEKFTSAVKNENQQEPARLTTGLLFDFDGTLYGDWRLWISIIEETLSGFEITVDPLDALEMARRMIDNGGNSNTTLRISGIAAALAKARGVDLPEEKVRTKFFERLDAHMDQTGPDEKLVGLLKEFTRRGFRMGIVTFVRRPRIQRRLDVWKLEEYFRSVITPDDEPEFKPSPRPFLKAMRELQVQPDKCFVIGDEPVDMMGGKQAGAKTIGLPQGFFTGQELEKAGADRILISLAMLPTALPKQLDSKPESRGRTTRRVDRPNSHDLERILTSKDFAQFGDALLNFAYSLALTETTGEPKGTRVPDKMLAEAAVKAGLRKRLPRRVGRGDIANGLEALLGYSWLENNLTLDEIVACLKAEALTPVENFAKLAELALTKLDK